MESDRDAAASGGLAVTTRIAPRVTSARLPFAKFEHAKRSPAKFRRFGFRAFFNRRRGNGYDAGGAGTRSPGTPYGRGLGAFGKQEFPNLEARFVKLRLAVPSRAVQKTGDFAVLVSLHVMQ